MRMRATEQANVMRMTTDYYVQVGSMTAVWSSETPAEEIADMFMNLAEGILQSTESS